MNFSAVFFLRRPASAPPPNGKLPRCCGANGRNVRSTKVLAYFFSVRARVALRYGMVRYGTVRYVALRNVMVEISRAAVIG